MSIHEFLSKKPSGEQLLNYIKQEAQRIAAERQLQGETAPIN